MVRARQLASVAQLVRALYPNRRAADSIPARDPYSCIFRNYSVLGLINVYTFSLNSFHLQDSSTIIQTSEMPAKSRYFPIAKHDTAIMLENIPAQ